MSSRSLAEYRRIRADGRGLTPVTPRFERLDLGLGLDIAAGHGLEEPETPSTQIGAGIGTLRG